MHSAVVYICGQIELSNGFQLKILFFLFYISFRKPEFMNIFHFTGMAPMNVLCIQSAKRRSFNWNIIFAYLILDSAQFYLNMLIIPSKNTSKVDKKKANPLTSYSILAEKKQHFQNQTK